MGGMGVAKAATSVRPPTPTWAHYFRPHLEQTHVDEQTGEEGVGAEGGRAEGLLHQGICKAQAARDSVLTGAEGVRLPHTAGSRRLLRNTGSGSRRQGPV